MANGGGTMSLGMMRDVTLMRTVKGTTKFVLMMIANAGSDETREAYISQSRLVDQTGLDQKTVVACVHRLLESGVLVDTGKRAGPTKSVTVWRLELSTSPPESGGAKPPQKRGVFDAGSPPKIPVKPPQNSGKAPPNLGGQSNQVIKKRALRAREALPTKVVHRSAQSDGPDIQRRLDEVCRVWAVVTGTAPNATARTVVAALDAEGATVDHLRLAWSVAQERKPGQARIPVQYLAPIVRDAMAGRLSVQRAARGETSAASRAWMHNDEALRLKCVERGIEPRPGEDRQAVRARVARAMEAAPCA